MGDVTPLHASTPSDPVKVWGEALVTRRIEPDDIPGPIMRLVVAYLADEVRQARFAARMAIAAVKHDDKEV